jgi:hypothetical protein
LLENKTSNFMEVVMLDEQKNGLVYEGSETSVVVLNSGTDVLRWVADGLLEVADRVDNPKVGVVTQDYSTPLQGLDWVYELAALALHHVLKGLGEDRNKLVKEHDTESDCDSFVGHLLEPVPMLSVVFGAEEIDRRIKGYV